jgi:hypothetical protein
MPVLQSGLGSGGIWRLMRVKLRTLMQQATMSAKGLRTLQAEGIADLQLAIHWS